MTPLPPGTKYPPIKGDWGRISHNIRRGLWDKGVRGKDFTVTWAGKRGPKHITVGSGKDVYVAQKGVFTKVGGQKAPAPIPTSLGDTAPLAKKYKTRRKGRAATILTRGMFEGEEYKSILGG